MVKNAVWSCVLNQDIPKKEQMVNLTLLNEVMLEIKIFIQFDELKRQIVKSTQIQPEDESSKKHDSSATRHLLKRFSVLSPISLKKTIVKCESLGLIQN